MPWMKTYFQLASGIKEPISVPVGTCAALESHIESVTKTLELEVVQYKDNPPRWGRYSPPQHIPNHIAARTVFEHNRFVREFYDDLAKWSQSPPDEACESFTPEFAASIWYGLSMLSIDYDRWIEEVYVEEMEMLFDVMRGQERGGIKFGEDPLTDKQAAAVISLFSAYFDRDDVRLTLPNDCDFLVTSDDYYWCPSHGAWHWQDVEHANYDYEEYRMSDNFICPADGCNEVIG